MKTFLLLLLTGLASCLPCKAQTFPASAERFRHHEISVSYGFLPITDANSIAEEVFAPVMTFGAYKRESTSYYGALNISYFYRFNHRISLGVTGGLTGNKGTASSFYEFLDRKAKDNRTYLFVLPTFRYHWLTRPNFSLYSSAGLGAYFLRNNIDGEIYHRNRFAYQFNYLGIEYGRQFAFFAEFGVGYTGVIMAGGRFRF